MQVKQFSRTVSLLITIVICSAIGFANTGSDISSVSTGFVYAATNKPSGNSVVQYLRATNGALLKVSEVATGGLGGSQNVGDVDPLGSQNSLVLNDIGSVLLVVNAGSNELSSLQAGRSGLKLISKVSSGGTFPNSVALHEDLVYVLNAGGTPSIRGFRISSTGALQPIPGSDRSLPGGAMAQPHDIRFNPDGTRLIVTEGGTHQIDIFELSNAGVSTGVITQRSAGDGPFGFTFGRNGAVLSTEAVSNSLSSYWLTPLSMLDVISDAVPSTQMATCWISLTRTGQVGFVSNTASGTLSSYTVDRDGTVHRANAVAASLPGGAPIDSSLTNDSAYLYVVDSAMGRIFGYRVNGTGLQSIGITTGLPKTVQGIAAR